MAINSYEVVPEAKTYELSVYVYDGTNAQEAIDFIDKFNANPNEMTEPIYRPKDLPNLPYDEFRKWWLSKDEVTEAKRWPGDNHVVHTHTESNLPVWGQNEDFYITIPATEEYSRVNGFVENVYMKKGYALYHLNGYVDYMTKFTDIKDLLDDLDLVLVR